MKRDIDGSYWPLTGPFSFTRHVMDDYGSLVHCGRLHSIYPYVIEI